MSEKPENQAEIERLYKEEIAVIRAAVDKVIAQLAERFPGSGRPAGTVVGPKTDIEKVLGFFATNENLPSSPKDIMAATGVSRSSLSQILYKNHKDRFEAFLAPGYQKRRLWRLRGVAVEAGAPWSKEAGAAGAELSEAHERPTLFGVEGDLAELDAADCCFRILRDHGNQPMNALSLTREALRRGYRARTKGPEDEVLIRTCKSFWARLGRDQRFAKVRPLVYKLRVWPP